MVKDPCHVGQRLKAIREQFARLEDDFKSKMIEEAMLQTEVDKLNHAIEDSEGDAIEAIRLSDELKQKIAALLRDRGGVSIYFTTFFYKNKIQSTKIRVRDC